jgi:hypothetical protein
MTDEEAIDAGGQFAIDLHPLLRRKVETMGPERIRFWTCLIGSLAGSMIADCGYLAGMAALRNIMTMIERNKADFQKEVH